jgi:hypothetical protein
MKTWYGARHASCGHPGYRLTDCTNRLELHRDKALEAAVLRLVDYAHPAATHFLQDALMSDGPADGEIVALRRGVALRIYHRSIPIRGY